MTKVSSCNCTAASPTLSPGYGGKSQTQATLCSDGGGCKAFKKKKTKKRKASGTASATTDCVFATNLIVDNTRFPSQKQEDTIMTANPLSCLKQITTGVIKSAMCESKRSITTVGISSSSIAELQKEPANPKKSRSQRKIAYPMQACSKESFFKPILCLSKGASTWRDQCLCHTKPNNCDQGATSWSVRQTIDLAIDRFQRPHSGMILWLCSCWQRQFVKRTISERCRALRSFVAVVPRCADVVRDPLPQYFPGMQLFIEEELKQEVGDALLEIDVLRASTRECDLSRSLTSTARENEYAAPESFPILPLCDSATILDKVDERFIEQADSSLGTLSLHQARSLTSPETCVYFCNWSDELEESSVMHQIALFSNYVRSDLMLRSTSPSKADPAVRLIIPAYSC